MAYTQESPTFEKKALIIYPPTSTPSTLFDAMIPSLRGALQEVGVSSEVAASSDFLMGESSILIDWDDPLSLENAVVGFNWILLFFPFIPSHARASLTSLLEHAHPESGIYHYAKQLRDLIEAMARVSGQSTRLLVTLESSPLDYFSQSPLETHRALAPYGQPLVDISSIYRSQGFPISFCVPSPPHTYSSLVKSTLRRLTNKREFPFFSYVS